MKFWNIILKILESIITCVLCLIGAIIISPFIVLYVVIELPLSVIMDIWDEER